MRSRWLKADELTEVTVRLLEYFDGENEEQQAQFNIGTDWTQVEMEHTPHRALYGTLTAIVSLPEGRTVLVDSVTFRPVDARR